MTIFVVRIETDDPVMANNPRSEASRYLRAVAQSLILDEHTMGRINGPDGDLVGTYGFLTPETDATPEALPYRLVPPVGGDS